MSRDDHAANDNQVTKIPVGGLHYLTVLCEHPYLVSLLFAVLLSLHLVTLLMHFITCIYSKNLCRLFQVVRH